MPAPRRRGNGALWDLALRNKNRLCSKTCGGKKGLQTLKKFGFGKGAVDPKKKRTEEHKNKRIATSYIPLIPYTFFLKSGLAQSLLIRKEADMPA